LALLGLAASVLPVTFALEETIGLGSLFTLRGPVAPPADVVIVGISRDSARAVGQTAELDTWSRSLHAALVDELAEAGATAVAFDLSFHEARDALGDRQFAEAIERAGNVLLLEDTDDSREVPLDGQTMAQIEVRTPPLPQLKAGALGSAPFILPTVPVRVGQAWTFDRVTGDRPSLPALALQAHLLAQHESLVHLLEKVRPGSTAHWPQTATAVRQQRNLELTMGTLRQTFRADASLQADAAAELARGTAHDTQTAAALKTLLDLYGGEVSRYVNFYGPARAVRTVPYDRVLGGANDVDVRGKLVLVGVSESLQPRQQDAFYSVFSQSSGINLSGVEVGASLVGNLLEQRTLEVLPLPLHIGLVAAFGLLFGAFVPRSTMLSVAIVTALAAALYFAAVYWQFASQHVWLPLVVPLLCQLPAGFAVAAWWNYRDVALQRERVRTALGYYVPQSLARRLTLDTVSSANELLHGTCLVTDAEHYTSVAESLKPAELAALMNEYYGAIFEVVQTYGGEISDTAGDSMIAVWASAEPDAAARRRAAQAAIAIPAAVDDFNRRHPDARLPTRIGLESGEMLLGNIGAELRYEYRAIGDIVNTASRIQGLNQLLGTRVLLSAAALEGAADIAARDVGTFLLRGKRLPVRVLEPLAASRVALDAEGMAAFAAAMDAFRAASWQEAHERFAELAARFPEDGPSRYFAALAGGWQRDPPARWTGAVRVTEK
jgi:adenylate cyclase